MKRLLALSLLWSAAWIQAPAAHAQTPTPVPTPAASLSIGDATTIEGNTHYRELLFPVTLSRARSVDVSASFVTKDITATAGSDYTPQSAGQIVIKSGETKANVLVRVLGDTVEEKDETFLVQLGAPKHCTISDSDAIGTIVDEDYSGQITISDTSFTELNTEQKVAKVQVTVSPAPLHPITVNYKTGDDTAKVSLADYVATSGSLVFKPGRLVLTVAVPIVGDRFAEADERLFVRIEAPGYNITKSLGVITILNDDTEPLPPSYGVSITDATLVEGDSGTTTAQLAVTLDQPAAQDMQVRFATADGSAKAGEDYLSTYGVLKFGSGQTTASISVPVIGDSIEEGAESFHVQLAAPGGLTGPTKATVSIRDNDYKGQISIASASVLEGQSDQKLVSLAVSLSSPHLFPLEIGYITSDATATAPGDYTPTAGTLTIPVGEQKAMVTVPVVGDTANEADETLGVQLSGAGLTFAQSLGVITIYNDDGATLGSPLSGKVVFDSGRDGNSEIYVMNANGSNQTRLTNNSASETAAAWSPDGTRIAFQSDRDGNSEIYVMNADGSGQTRLTDNAATDSSPAWSPDGQKIVFESGRGGGYFRLFVMNADGSAVQQVPATDSGIDTYASFRYPAWSPDGTRIAFDRSGGLAIMNADGTARSFFTLSAVGANHTTASDPTFSPDGARIAYSLYAAKRTFVMPGSSGRSRTTTVHNYQIYVMNADGSGQTRLTQNGTGLDQDPSFSPDGKNIAFGSSRSGVNSIFVIRSDGANELLITDGANPSWASGSVSSARRAASAPPSPPPASPSGHSS